jgi:hypothetical protein
MTRAAEVGEQGGDLAFAVCIDHRHAHTAVASAQHSSMRKCT